MANSRLQRAGGPHRARFCRLQPGGSLPHGQSFRDHIAGARQFVGTDYWLATSFASSRGSGRKASAGAFLDEVAFELAERPKEVEHQPAAGRGGVDCLGEGAEADAPLLQRRNSFDQVRQRAAEPIQFPDDQHITVARVVERLPQAGSIGVSTRDPVFEESLEHPAAVRASSCSAGS